MGFYRLAYTVPVGYWGTRVGASYTTFHYHLQEELKPTQSYGDGTVLSVFALHPVIRTRGANLIAQLGYSDMSFNDRVGAADFNIDRRIHVTRAGLVGDFRDGLFGGGLNSFSFNHSRGYATINQNTLYSKDKDSVQTIGRYTKQNYEYRRLQKIDDQSNVLLWVRGQFAGKNLMSAEQFSLGGPDGVRSYPTGEALGDEGIIFTAEYRYILPGVKIWEGDVTLSGFWDQGHLQILDQCGKSSAPATTCGQNHRNLSGYGFGVSAGKDSDYVLRMSAAWRNEDEGPRSVSKENGMPRVWVQGIKWF